MANHRFCETLQNIFNLGPRYTQAKIYVIPDPYFVRFEDKGVSTEITLSKLQQRECGAFIIKSIWKENLDKVLGFDISPENTELIFYTKSQIHVYSFFNELVEEVKQVDIKRLFQNPHYADIKEISNVLPIHCTLQIAQFIVCTNKNQAHYVIVDINKELLQTCVKLNKAQCCAWHMEIIYVLTTDGLLCKYNTFSGVLISEDFNIYSVIPKLDQHLELKHLCVSCNNKDVCLVDNLGSIYLFQIEEDQSDIETGLDICSELGLDSSTPSKYDSSSKKKWSFLQKIMKSPKQDAVFPIDSSPVQSTSSVFIMEKIIPDVNNVNSFSIEFLMQGLAVWTRDQTGGKYRIFSRDKGELLIEYEFSRNSCLLMDPTIKYEDRSYQFVAADQSIQIPIGSEIGYSLFKEEVETSSTTSPSKWDNLFKLLSSSNDLLSSKNELLLIDLVNASFEYNQIDILECCIESHLNQFQQDICDNSDMMSSVNSEASLMARKDLSGSPHGLISSVNSEASLIDKSRKDLHGSPQGLLSGLSGTSPGLLDRYKMSTSKFLTRQSSNISESQLSHVSQVNSDLFNTRLSSMETLDKILEVIILHGQSMEAKGQSMETKGQTMETKGQTMATKGQNMETNKFYSECLDRLVSHLVHLVTLCNERDSSMLAFQILKTIPSLLSQLYETCAVAIYSLAWQSLLPTQSLYLTIHSPQYNGKLGTTVNISNDQVMTLLTECIDNRDFQQVRSVIDKVGYNLGDNLRSFFLSTLNRNSREFILLNVTIDVILNEQEYDIYDCYKDMQSVCRKLTEFVQYNQGFTESVSDKTEFGSETLQCLETYDDNLKTIDSGNSESLVKIGKVDLKEKDLEGENSSGEFVDRKTNVKVTTENELLDMKIISDILDLSFGELLSYTKEHRMEMIAQLYFKSYDSCLLKYLNKEVCWKHLVEQNMVSEIQDWISGNAVWMTSDQWNIDQLMIDQVHTLSTTSATKELILNKFCTMFGIFSSVEQSNILSIVSRLIKCERLNSFEQVLRNPMSNITYDTFITQLILYCIQSEQWRILTSLLETFTERPLETRSLSPVKLWSYVNQTFSPSSSCQQKEQNLLHLISSIATIVDVTNDPSVIICQSFIRTSSHLNARSEQVQETRQDDSSKMEETTQYASNKVEETRQDAISTEKSENEGDISENKTGVNNETDILSVSQELNTNKPNNDDKTDTNISDKLKDGQIDINIPPQETFDKPEVTFDKPQNDLDINIPNELISSSKFYKTALTTPNPEFEDINLSTLVLNNPSFNFSTVLSRSYSSMSDKFQSTVSDKFQSTVSDKFQSTVSGEFQINFSHLLKQKRGLFSYYEDVDRFNLDEMYATMLNNARDSGLVTSSLGILKLLGVNEVSIATLVRAARCLGEQNPVDQLKDYSKPFALKWIAEKGASRCSDLKTWCPIVDLCKQNNMSIPDVLFDNLTKQNQWMEFLIACDVFDIADGDKLIYRFDNITTRQHLKYALGNTLSHIDTAHTELMDVIESCHSNTQSLLEAAHVHSEPCLALLAASVDEHEDYQTLSKCLRLYLLACLKMKDGIELSLIQIMGMAIEGKCLALLEDGLQMLFPDCSLTHYVSALCDFIMFDGKQTLQKMKSSIDEILSDPSNNTTWTIEAIVFLTHKALSLLSSFGQLELLNTLHEAEFHSIEPLGQVSLSNILSKATCLQRTDIYLNFLLLWPKPDVSYEKSILNGLLERKLFGKAAEFCCLCQLPLDTVLVSQWTDLIAQEKYRTDLEFWKTIDEDFKKNNISDEVGFEFFTSQVDHIRTPVDKYKCLKLGLDRESKFHPELYVRLYCLCLSEEFTLSQLNECWNFNPTVTTFDITGVKLAPINVPGQDSDVKLILDKPNNTSEAKLDPNRVNPEPNNTQLAPLNSNITINTKSATNNGVKIATFDFTSKKLAPSSPVESLSTEMKLVTSSHIESLTTDMKLTTSHHSRLDSLIASMLNKGDLYNASLVSRLFKWEYNDCLVLEQMAKATSQTESGEDVLVHLATKLRHGKTLAQFFVAAYRLMCSLDLTMVEILSQDMNLILNQIWDAELSIESVQDLVTLSYTKLSQSDIAQVIGNVVYSTLQRGLTNEAMSNRLILWGLDLNTEFSRFISLCDATELGLCLYYKAKDFLSKETISDEDTLRQIVELLILSHDCFTSACNMEGVVSVLNKARHLVVVHLLGQSAWSLMVRLLTGIGRYVEMSYVYQLLKENQQFEFLLRKGYDKNPSFKLATLDFVRADKSLFELVALNFRLYAELATMFESDGIAMVTKLELNGDGRLMCNETNRTILNDVIDNYAHAAQHFIQAQKLKQATSIVNQAELMSLQLDLLQARTGDCLAIYAIPAKDLSNTLAYHLTYQQAMVVMNAYDCTIDWSLVLYVQVIDKGNRSYLTTWLTNHRLSSNIAQDIASRYQKELKPTPSMTSHMKYLVAQVKPLELKYKLCSQLNFKDILQSIIVNPDVAWLKDTVWQEGYKQKGGLK